jgi:hypothetical protein
VAVILVKGAGNPKQLMACEPFVASGNFSETRVEDQFMLRFEGAKRDIGNGKLRNLSDSDAFDWFFKSRRRRQKCSSRKFRAWV